MLAASTGDLLEKQKSDFAVDSAVKREHSTEWSVLLARGGHSQRRFRWVGAVPGSEIRGSHAQRGLCWLVRGAFVLLCVLAFLESGVFVFRTACYWGR